MRIMGLAAAAAVLTAAGGTAALACASPGPCAYAPESGAYVFQPPGPMRHAMPPRAGGPASSAYIVAPGPTPGYAGDEAGEAEGGYDYDRYGGEYRGEREHGGTGHGVDYGAVRRAGGEMDGYLAAFGRGVETERPYAGPGYGYRVEHHASCGACAPRPRFVSPCAEACEHGRADYEHRQSYYAEAKPVHVESDFFFGGISGGAGYGVDGGGWGGGGGFFSDSGYGFSATQGFSRSMASAFAGASASAHASAKAFAFSYGGHPKMGHGGGCNVCGGKSGGKH